MLLLLLLILLLLLLFLLLLLLLAQKGINRKVNQQLFIYISTIFKEGHKMPPYTCGICLKSTMISLKRHMRAKHSTYGGGEKKINKTSIQWAPDSQVFLSKKKNFLVKNDF